jgi:hypothetical protein
MAYEDPTPVDPMPDVSNNGAGDSQAVPMPARPGERFRTELAQALQVVAGHERDRLAADVSAAAERQIEWTRSRGAVEADELRKRATEDAAAIKAWSDGEVDRIRAEARRRAEEREADLHEYLERHEAMIEVEVEAVTTAVRTYESTLVEFFDDMTSSMDLAHIARQADLIPEPPNLEIVRADAREATVSRFAQQDVATNEPSDDGVAVGVMDPEAIGSTSDVLEAIAEASSGAEDEVASETEVATADIDSASPEAEPVTPEAEAETPETEAETPETEAETPATEVEAPATNDGVLVAGTSGSADQPNAAARFLRSFGWSATPAEGTGGETGQPR